MHVLKCTNSMHYNSKYGLAVKQILFMKNRWAYTTTRRRLLPTSFRLVQFEKLSEAGKISHMTAGLFWDQSNFIRYFGLKKNEKLH